jgi:hypothetical protein
MDVVVTLFRPASNHMMRVKREGSQAEAGAEIQGADIPLPAPEFSPLGGGCYDKMIYHRHCPNVISTNGRNLNNSKGKISHIHSK